MAQLLTRLSLGLNDAKGTSVSNSNGIPDSEAGSSGDQRQHSSAVSAVSRLHQHHMDDELVLDASVMVCLQRDGPYKQRCRGLPSQAQCQGLPWPARHISLHNCIQVLSSVPAEKGVRKASSITWGQNGYT